MESYIEKLDQLIAIKKKKGYKTTKKESEEFLRKELKVVGI